MNMTITELNTLQGRIDTLNVQRRSLSTLDVDQKQQRLVEMSVECRLVFDAFQTTELSAACTRLSEAQILAGEVRIGRKVVSELSAYIWDLYAILEAASHSIGYARIALEA